MLLMMGTADELPKEPVQKAVFMDCFLLIVTGCYVTDDGECR